VRWGWRGCRVRFCRAWGVKKKHWHSGRALVSLLLPVTGASERRD